MRREDTYGSAGLKARNEFGEKEWTSGSPCLFEKTAVIMAGKAFECDSPEHNLPVDD